MIYLPIEIVFSFVGALWVLGKFEVFLDKT